VRLEISVYGPIHPLRGTVMYGNSLVGVLGKYYPRPFSSFSMK